MKKFKNIRRKGALERLERQLELGTKTTKEGTVELSEKDSKRISREIEILRSRI